MYSPATQVRYTWLTINGDNVNLDSTLNFHMTSLGNGSDLIGIRHRNGIAYDVLDANEVISFTSGKCSHLGFLYFSSC